MSSRTGINRQSGGLLMATPSEKKAISRAAQEAANAAYGDSNDEEIQLLRDALEMALEALGLQMPEAQDPGDSQ